MYRQRMPWPARQYRRCLLLLRTLQAHALLLQNATALSNALFLSPRHSNLRHAPLHLQMLYPASPVRSGIYPETDLNQAASLASQMALPDLLLVREHVPALFALMGAEKRVHLQAAQHTNHHAQMRTGSENRAVRHLHPKRQTGQIPRQPPHRGEHLTCQFYSQ